MVFVGICAIKDPARPEVAPAIAEWRAIRAASGRDVYLESVKDIGIAIYSRAMAARVSSRLAELGDFSTLKSGHARWLARRHDLPCA